MLSLRLPFGRTTRRMPRIATALVRARESDGSGRHPLLPGGGSSARRRRRARGSRALQPGVGRPRQPARNLLPPQDHARWALSFAWQPKRQAGRAARPRPADRRPAQPAWSSWVHGSDVGLRFDDPADMFALITRNLVQPARRRAPHAAHRARLPGLARSRLAARRSSPLATCPTAARASRRACLWSSHEQVVLTLDGFRPAPAHRALGAGQCRRHRLRARAAVAGTDALAAPAPAGPRRAAKAQRHRRASPTSPPRRRRGASGTSIALNLAARVREGSRRWSIEIESIDTRESASSAMRRSSRGGCSGSRCRGWKAGRRGSWRSTATASPAPSPSRSIRRCWSGCWRWPARGRTSAEVLSQLR